MTDALIDKAAGILNQLDPPTPRVTGDQLHALAGRPSGNGHQAATEDTGDTWQPVDLGPIVDGVLDGTIVRQEPTVGRIDDGSHLFVAGKVNGAHGAAGTGKTMVVQVVAQQLTHAGEVVWFIDFEDDEHGLVLRLLDLGTDPGAIRQRVRYRRPDQVLDLERQGELLAHLEQDRPAMVVVDSTGEWLGLQGVEDKDGPIARFLNTCARPLASTGAAVVLIDHVPHQEKDRLAPIGSQRKVAAVNGCQYLVTTVAEMARGRIGKARLTVAKDRTGTRARGTIAAELLIDSTGPTMAAQLLAPAHDTGSDEGPMAGLPPAARRVHAALAQVAEAVTVSVLGDLVAGDGTTGTGLKRRTIQDALKRLEELDLVVRTPTGFADLWALSESPSDDEENTP